MNTSSCKKEQCCCRCEFLIELRKHPSNQVLGGVRGSVLECLGWVCVSPELQEPNKRIGIFFDSQHGICESFKQKVRV